MNYSFQIDQMTWSYSRIQSFLKCPHSFFVHYITGEEEDDTFLASYGSFVHQIHELVFSGFLKRNEAADYYLENFADFVHGGISKEIYAAYYRGAYEYFKNMPTFEGEIVGVEKEFKFDVLGHPFIGFTDLITRTDSGLLLYDHKAKNLKPYSGRKKPTKTDVELDEYFRQLYLYAHAMHQEFGEYPKQLIFNCYRSQTMIKEDFYEDKMHDVLRWCDERIQEIRNYEKWNPDIDFFKCRYLCGLNDRCDYHDLM